MLPHIPADRHFTMTVPQFETAVKSMEGWPGSILGIMGGNPVLHPDFAPISHKFAELWGRPSLATNGRAPIADFAIYANERLHDQSSGRGLWSSLGYGYYRHFELIQEVYDYQCLNDHRHAGLHQGLLISRADYCEKNGITDDQWLEAVSGCWVQNTWSASVNPHGAYPCEVMGAIDHLFYDGKHAWPIEKGWWERTPEDFGDMLKLCDHCALAQQGPAVVANVEVDIVSKDSLPMLERVGSPALKNNRLEIYDPANQPEHRHNGRKFRIDWYMPEPYMRVDKDNETIKPKRFAAVMVCVGQSDKLRKTLPKNAGLVDQVVVVTTAGDVETQEIAKAAADLFGNVTLVLSNRCYDGGDAFNKGKMLNDGLAAVNRPDWVVTTDCDIYLNPATGVFKKHVLNPGMLYGCRRLDLDGPALSDFAAGKPIDDSPAAGVNTEPNGYFQLFNRNARHVRDRWPRVFSESFCSAGGVDSQFMQAWPADKRLTLFGIPVAHLPHGSGLGSGWNGGGSDAGPRWRQIALMVADDSVRMISPDPPYPARLRLTDTLEGESVELDIAGHPWSAHIPADVLTRREVSPGVFDLVFKGRRLDGAHVHVAAFV